ncbi:MAG TPA: MlaD family protein [Solirubrobacterales bacterium]|jgi:ABC-type transporter Mla subunit MlaD|nr:MlaD family protein [Solirubrobacterales bacterium]
MRKWLIPGALVVVVVLLVVLLGGGGGNGYVVRGIFDSGGFMVAGEEVRVAGATVGEIESVSVTMPGEIDGYKNGKPISVPGKAVIAMKINDPGFQDFRADASCLIRPQSLIGEKFVDCRPTLPRAPGSKPPPPLKEIEDGKPGAGQYLLPFENNSTSVDPDLINNINQLTYAQRFRLILNELGAGLAGRGEDLEEVVKRANPVLRDVDRVFGILNAQRDRLAQLSADSEKILGPLSRERSSVAGFFSNAGVAAQASAEKGADVEASLRKLPGFLRELRQTMASFQYFSKAGTPVSESLAKAAPALTAATRALTPFSAASTVSLKSLGANGETAGPKLRAANPIVEKTRELGQSGATPVSELAELLVSTRKNKGFDSLVDLIYNSAGATNEFDKYGHFARSLTALTNCTEYVAEPTSGCSANFNGEGSSSSASAASISRLYKQLGEQLGGKTGGTSSGVAPVEPRPVAPGQAKPAPNPEASGLGEGEQLGAKSKATTSSQRALLDYLLGP